MSTHRIRGWAGVAIGTLGLLLLRAGPGFAVSASAAPGCRDNAYCRSVNSVEGTIGPGGIRITSSTATCEGDCNGAGECLETSWQNPDGTRTFHCSCHTGPPMCSGYAKMKRGENGTEECMEFECEGPCESPEVPTAPLPECQREPYDTTSAEGCPTPVTGKIRCVCR